MEKCFQAPQNLQAARGYNERFRRAIYRRLHYHLNEKTSLSQNSKASYYQKLTASLKQAVKDGLLADNPTKGVKGVKGIETKREFLTLDEIKQLIKVDCELPILKNAFLFSAFTGLRFSDIEALKWRDLQDDGNGGYCIRFTQKKTKGVETMPISKPAMSIVGERGQHDAKIFDGLQYSGWTNQKLKMWILKAGITKNITFHCARHSFATLQLTLGTDIYAVSKLLGRNELRTTQVYAKIVNQKKTDAVNKLNDLNV